MKTIFLLALIFAASLVQAQVAAQNIQTPQGTFFTESFGDTGTQPCGYGTPWNTGLYAYTGCDNVWGKTTLGTGGSIAVAASPGATTYPRGPKSLHIVTGTSATWVQTVGFTPTVPSGSTFDVKFTLNVSATALTAFGTQRLYALSLQASALSYPCAVNLYAPSLGTIAVEGSGTGG